MVRVFLLKLLERSSNKDRAWFQNLPSCWTVHSEDLLRLSWLVNAADWSVVNSLALRQLLGHTLMRGDVVFNTPTDSLSRQRQ